MENGQCPRCNSHEIYESIDGGGIGDGFAILVLQGDSMKPTRKWKTILCAACGYYENYLLDRDMIETIIEDAPKAGWKKLP